GSLGRSACTPGDRTSKRAARNAAGSAYPTTRCGRWDTAARSFELDERLMGADQLAVLRSDAAHSASDGRPHLVEELHRLDQPDDLAHADDAADLDERGRLR